MPSSRILTGGLLSYNLPEVRLGYPTFPYLLAGVGYPALAIVTVLFAVRFLKVYEAQQSMAVGREAAPEAGAEGATLDRPTVQGGGPAAARL